MKRFLFCIAACLPVLASASSYVFSGKVTDKSGNGIAGIWVGLSQAKIATLTASDGSWSFGATSGIADRAAHRTAVTRHLVNENGHLQLSFDGKDLSGRNLSGIATASQAVPTATVTARASDAAADTLLYVVRGNSILASTVVNSTSFQTGTVEIDTAWSLKFTKSGDTLYYPSSSYADIYCNDSTLYVWHNHAAQSEADLVHITAEGLELIALSSDESDSKYQEVTKFSRLSGDAGSLVGKFQITGNVYRPLIANVPDSVVKIIAEDSALDAVEARRKGLIYTFTDNTISLSGQNAFSFASQFIDNWAYASEGWYYSTYDSSWRDDRKYSDSAQHNVTAQIFDSSTVKLTGNTTKEVVTITSANGFDQTYSSSNSSAHATGTQLAIPTSCPEAASWYRDFLSANRRATAAARVAGPSTMTPKHKKHRQF